MKMPSPPKSSQCPGGHFCFYHPVVYLSPTSLMKLSQCPGGHLFFFYDRLEEYIIASLFKSQCPGGHLLFLYSSIWPIPQICSLPGLNALAGICSFSTRSSGALTCAIRPCLNALAGIRSFSTFAHMTPRVSKLTSLNALTGICCFSARIVKPLLHSLLDPSQCPGGHLLLFYSSVTHWYTATDHRSQCPGGHSFFFYLRRPHRHPSVQASLNALAGIRSFSTRTLPGLRKFV